MDSLTRGSVKKGGELSQVTLLVSSIQGQASSIPPSTRLYTQECAVVPNISNMT